MSHRFTQDSFGPVLRSGRKLRGRHAVVHVLNGTPSHSRLGIALAKRVVRSAVARNRLRRILREVFRLHPVSVQGLDCVITFRENPADEAALVREVRGFFDELCVKT